MNSKLKYLFVFMFLFITMSFVSADLTTDLVSYYKFDENAIDSVGSNDITITGASNVTGKINNSYDFGVWDYGSIPYGVADGLTDFTFSFWGKIDVLNTAGEYPGNYVFSGANTIEDDELYIGYIYDASSWALAIDETNYYFATNTSVIDLDWHHIVVIRDGTSARLYIDGSQIGSDITVASTTLDISSSGFILAQEQEFDGGGFTSNQSWNGKLDEIGIWSRALTSTEVSELYNSGAGNSYPFILTGSTIINPQPILYTNNAYNFLGTFVDSYYNSETTYEYSFGYNNTNSFNGSEIYIDTNQNLDYAQTESKDFNLNKTFDNTDVDEDLYSFFTVHKYINGVYDKSITGWSSTTFDIVQAEIKLNVYDENTLLPISTVRITDSNGTTHYTNASGYINLGQLSGNKSFTISKTGYDSRKLDFFFKVSDYYDWNFALTQAGNSESIDFIVKDSNNNLWRNKYLMFYDNGESTAEKELDIYQSTIGTNSIDVITFGIAKKSFYLTEFQFAKSNTTQTNTLSITIDGEIVYSYPPQSFLYNKLYTFDCNILVLAGQSVGITGVYAWYNNSTITTNDYFIGSGHTPARSTASGVPKIKITPINLTGITSSILTSSSGTATASLLPAGDYTALLYDATGTLVDTYEKTTVTVNKPKNEKTSALISPYDIYVSGLLQYNLTNKSESSVTFNVFAGTTGFYTFTAVDYNTVVADQKYIPKSYFVQVPMGNDYESAVSYTPYLLLKTDGIVPKVVVLDQLNRTIENAQIYVSKYVGGVLTIVESGNTFSNGAFNFSAYPLDVYYLTVYYNGTDYGTFSVQPRESSDIFYIKIDRTTAEDVAQKLLIQTNLDDTSRYQNRDTNINVLGTITSNFNYITDYNVNVYERGNLVYSVNTVATGLSIDINKFVDVNLIPDYVHSAVIKVIVNYSIAGVTGSQTFSKNIIVTDNTDVLATVSSAVTEIDQPLSMFIALAVAIMLMAVLIFFGILTDPAILAVFGALVIGVFMMLGFLDIGVVVLGMDIGRFAYFLGLMATLYFALFGGR